MVDNKTATNKQPAESKLAPKPIDPLKVLLQKKINHLKRKIILGIASLFGLIAVIAIIFLYYSDIKKTSEAQIKQIVDYMASVDRKTKDIKLKTTDVKKYKEIWKGTKESKKNFAGANMNEINSKFTELSEKYHIINSSIKISVPEVLKGGIYDRGTLSVSLSSVSISFDSLTDSAAINFVKDFTDILPGYVVVTDFSMKRTSENGFTPSDLVSISTGKFISGINAKLELSWYILKKKSGAGTGK